MSGRMAVDFQALISFPAAAYAEGLRFFSGHGLLNDGVQTITLEKLIELKLASGMSASDRLRDLADVQELI